MSLLKLVGLGLLAYAALVGFFVLIQRRMIYFPPRTYPVTPADAGLPHEEHILTAADGVKLPLWWIPQQSITAPVILCFHGNATNISGMVGWAATMHARGLACVLAEYRGYGRSEGRPTERGLYQDARAAYRWVRSRGIPPERLLIYGHSLGAAVAAWLAAEEPVAGVVLEGAFPSVHALARHHYWWLLVPESFVLDKFLTAQHLARVRCPALILHAEADGVVPLRFGREVFAAAPEPKTFCEIPAAGHNTFGLEVPEIAAVFDRFTASCLKTASRR